MKTPVWYMCLKIENCYLKIFIEIRVDEKVWYVCLKIENYCLKIFIKIHIGKKVH